MRSVLVRRVGQVRPPAAALATPRGMQKFANQHKRVCDATVERGEHREGENSKARHNALSVGVW